jgi:hypothetical protein
MSEGFDEVFDKLQTAADHTDRAERLREEAGAEAKAAVEQQLDFDADITVTEVSPPGRVRVDVEPRTLSLGDEDGDFHCRLTEPMEVVVTTAENPYNIDTAVDDIGQIKQLITQIQSEFDESAPVEMVYTHAEEIGFSEAAISRELEKLKQKGEVYEPKVGHLRGV